MGMSTLPNGQAASNAIQVAWFAEGDFVAQVPMDAEERITAAYVSVLFKKA